MAVRLQGRRVMVTGGAGFLGRAVVRRLETEDVADIFVPRSAQYDLRTVEGVEEALADGKPDVVIHLAAVVGGIGANREHPGSFFYENAAMGIHLMEQSRLVGVEKFVQIGTVCSYPKFTPVPFKEDDLWNGYPGGDQRALRPGQEDAAGPGPGVSRAVRVQRHPPHPGEPLRAGRQLRSGFVARHPGAYQEVRGCARDAGADHIEVWGTGTASREFLYVDDAAEGIVLGADRYDEPEPVNLGTGQEVTIRELIDLIVQLTGFEGEIRWDASKPDGQPRRALDTARARERFGFEARTDFEEGLRRAVESYVSRR